MKFQGAVIKEQGITFAVVIVKKYVINNKMNASKLINQFSSVFNGLPVVLMAQTPSGRPTYYGRKDISRFMSHVPLGAIPWREYTVS